MRSLDEDRELVAADSIKLAATVLEVACDASEELIACLVAALVIDLLEAADIEGDQAYRSLARPLESGGGVDDESATVGHPGEVVGVGEVALDLDGMNNGPSGDDEDGQAGEDHEREEGICLFSGEVC